MTYFDNRTGRAAPVPVRLIGIVLLAGSALLLRMYQIAAHEIWYDEAESYSLATIPNGLKHSNTPPLYFLLLRAWMSVAGTDEQAMRLLSAISGTLFVLVILWVGQALFNPSVGWWSAMFSAVAPIHIYYSQEARAYALMMLLVLMAYGLVWQALQRMTFVSWLLAATVASSAAYTHYFALIALLPTVLLVGIRPRAERTRRAWAAFACALLFSGLLLLPLIVSKSLISTHFTGWSTDWIKEVWNGTPPALAIPKSLEIFGLGSHKGLASNLALIKGYPYVESEQGLRLLGLATLIGLGIWVAMKKGDDHLNIPDVGERKVWLMGALFVPLAVLWSLSFYRPIYLVGRYDVIGFPAFAMVVGFGLAKLQALPRLGVLFVSVVALVLAVVISLKLERYYNMLGGHPLSASGRATAAFLDAEVKNGDAVIMTGQLGATTRYYLSRRGYVFREGYCQASSETTRERRFACRLYPQDWEKFLGIMEHAEETPTTLVSHLTSSLKDEMSSVWLAIDEWARHPSGRLLPWRNYEPLVAELERAGGRQVPLSEYDTLGIVEYRYGGNGQR